MVKEGGFNKDLFSVMSCKTFEKMNHLKPNYIGNSSNEIFATINRTE